MLQDKNKIILTIVDDHPIVMEGLKSLLVNEPGLHIAACFTRGAELLAFLKEHEVHIVLLDIMLPDINGIELCREIKAVAPDTCVLALSNHTERSMIMQMLQNGASGYLLKNASVAELVNCIGNALKGEVVFSKEAREIIARPGQGGADDPPRLTKREKQILQLVAEGKTTPAIAEELSLSPLTIETHRRNLLQKFNAKNVAELLMMAVQQRFL